MLDNNLVVEPVLICQCGQVVQCQCVFPVDHPERRNRFLNDRSSVFGNFWEDDVFPARGKKKVYIQTITDDILDVPSMNTQPLKMIAVESRGFNHQVIKDS